MGGGEGGDGGSDGGGGESMLACMTESEPRALDESEPRKPEQK